MENTQQKQTEFNQKTVAFINSLKSTLDLSQQVELEQSLGWTKEEFSEFLEGNKELSVIELSKLSRQFNFSLKAFNEERVDFTSIAKQHKGEKNHLPERYTKGPLTLSNMIFNGTLEMVEQFFGHNFKELAINDLQIGSYTLDNPDKSMCIQALKDLFQFLHTYGLSTVDLEYLGYCCCRGVLSSPEMEQINKIPNDQDLVFAFFEVASKRIATHFLFNIVENSKHKLIVDITENPEVAKYFAPERIGSPLSCFHMLGGFKAPLVQRGHHPIASHTTCIHRGDGVCRFEFDF